MTPEKIGGFEKTTPADPLQKKTIEALEEVNRPPTILKKPRPEKPEKEVEEILLESPVAETIGKKKLRKLRKRIENDLGKM